jgi:hypothetical protein
MWEKSNATLSMKERRLISVDLRYYTKMDKHGNERFLQIGQTEQHQHIS